MATITKLQRVFRFGGIDLPDLDSDLTPEEILSAYAEQYPTLRYGKVTEIGVEGDTLVYSLTANEYKANG